MEKHGDAEVLREFSEGLRGFLLAYNNDDRRLPPALEVPVAVLSVIVIALSPDPPQVIFDPQIPGMLSRWLNKMKSLHAEFELLVKGEKGRRGADDAED